MKQILQCCLGLFVLVVWTGAGLACEKIKISCYCHKGGAAVKVGELSAGAGLNSDCSQRYLESQQEIPDVGMYCCEPLSPAQALAACAAGYCAERRCAGAKLSIEWRMEVISDEWRFPSTTCPGL